MHGEQGQGSRDARLGATRISAAAAGREDASLPETAAASAQVQLE